MTSTLGDTLASALFSRPTEGQSLALVPCKGSSQSFAASSQPCVPGPAQEAGMWGQLLLFPSWDMSQGPPGHSLYLELF